MLLDRIVKVPLDVALPLGAVLCLTCLGCVVLVVVRSRPVGRRAGALLLVTALWWELSNAPVEGEVLVAVARGHGVHVADVIALQAALVGLALLLGPRRPPGRRPAAQH